MSLPSMKSRGLEPIQTLLIEDNYLFGFYSNNISSIKEIKYRQKDGNSKLGWTRIRQCRDILWTIEILKKSDQDFSELIETLYKLSMSINGKTLLKIFSVNGQYILGVYQGRISDYDLLIKYRQKENGQWSQRRTPKHIHWAVDVLIKMSLEENKTKEFLDFLINYWSNNVSPLMSEEERNNLLNDNLLNQVNNEATQYLELVGKGEYSVKFLLLIAKLLMFQEKTNLDTAYMFKNLLEALKDGQDIFKIVSIATHNRR